MLDLLKKLYRNVGMWWIGKPHEINVNTFDIIAEFYDYDNNLIFKRKICAHTNLLSAPLKDYENTFLFIWHPTVLSGKDFLDVFLTVFKQQGFWCDGDTYHLYHKLSYVKITELPKYNYSCKYYIGWDSHA